MQLGVLTLSTRRQFVLHMSTNLIHALYEWNFRRSLNFHHVNTPGAKVRLEDLAIKPYRITKLKVARILSVFDLAISIPHHPSSAHWLLD